MKIKTILAILMTFLVSCGGAKNKVEQGVAALSVERFQFDLVAGSREWKNLPDYNQSYFKSDFYRPGESHLNTITSGNEIMVKPVIDASRFSEGLYLVWSEEYLGESIVQASYFYEKVNLSNEGSGEYERIAAGYDSVLQRWFIPIGRFIEKPIESKETHWLTLDLVSKNGNRILIHIGMRFQDTTPRIEVTEMISEDQVKENFLRWSPSERLVLSRQRIENQNEVSAVIEISVDSKTALFTGISRPVLTHDWRGNESIAGQLNHRVPLDLVFEGVFVHRYTKGKSIWLDGAHSSEKLRIELDSNEVVDLEWIYGAVNGRKCSLPAPVASTYTYTVPKGRGESSDALGTSYAAYRVMGRAMTGRWSRQIQSQGTVLWQKKAEFSFENGINQSFTQTCTDCPDLTNCWF